MTLPPSLPIPGALQTLLWIRKPVEFMGFWSQRYGSAYRLKLMAISLNLFSDPESIRAIFASKPDDMHAGETNRVLRALVGEDSVLLLDGAAHLRRRKLLMPSFQGERMRLYGETMAEITRNEIARLRVGEVVALHPHTQEITLQVILRTVFGADEGAELTQLSVRIKRMLADAEYRIAFVILILLSARPELEKNVIFKRILTARDRADELLYQTIAERRADPGAPQRKDVLATLLQARDENGEKLTDRELRDELMTALAAGHETTATSLAWAVANLLTNPKSYAALREEIAAAGGVSATPEKLASLPYLDAVIKENLRLRPIVPVVGRMLKKPTKLGGYDLPAGSAVGACIFLAHRNPEIYPNPDSFEPERFLGVPVDPVHWLPFGGGIRRCIGAQFATYEMKVVLGTMLAHCDFALAQPTPVRTLRRAVTFFPEHGTRVKVLSNSAQAGKTAAAASHSPAATNGHHERPWASALSALSALPAVQLLRRARAS
jgi:cytochrome P450